MNFKDKKNYAKKLLTDTFGKPIYSADWAFAAWNVKNDIFITEEEDGGFLLVKRDMKLYNGDSDYVFDELYSSNSVNKVIAEAKKYTTKSKKGLGMNFNDKGDYARKLLKEEFGKPLIGGGADWIADTWQVNHNDIFIQEDDDRNFVLFKRTQTGDDDDPEYEFDELYSSQSVNKTIAEAKKYMKKQFKGLGNITPSNYFDTITPIVGKLPEWAKLMHQAALDLKAADIDPFTEDLGADDNQMMQNLLAEANKIAMASETKPIPKATPKPKLKKGDDVEVIQFQWHMIVSEDPIFDNDQGEWIYRLENFKDSFNKGNAGTYAESQLYKLDFKEKAEPKPAFKRTKPKAGVKKAVTKAKANKQKAISKPTPTKPVASSQQPAAKTAKKAAKQPSAAQIAARKKFAKMAKDKAKAKGGKTAKPTKTKAVSTKSKKAVKQVAKKAATKKPVAKKPAARSQKPAAKAEAPIVRNIKSIEIQHITRYLNLDGKNKTAKAVLNLAKEVKSSVAAKEYIQHTSILEEIHSKLTKAYNAITKAGVNTVDFNIDKDFKAKLTAILKNVKVRVQTNVLAGVNGSTITCDNCGHSWDKNQSAKHDMYICHNCSHDNTPKAMAGTDKKNVHYKLLSPDGFGIENERVFTNIDDIEPAFKNWAKQFKKQGYYSSNNGKIDLRDLADEMILKEIPISNTKKKSLKSTNSKPNIQHSKSLSGVTSAADMLNQSYKTIDLGPYKKYFGEVAHNFDLMFHGEPGAGKTYFLLKFANWYANNIGNVLFVSDEEYGTITLQNKIAETNSNSPNLYFSKSINGVNVSDYALVILDSINSIGLTLEQYIALRSKNPNTAMIGILQKTKDGNFRGGKEWEHEFEIAGELIFNDKNQRCIKTYKNRYGILKEQKI
jgi:hypothetical protein